VEHTVNHRPGNIAAMANFYFTPHQAELRPCWHCTSFAGMLQRFRVFNGN
jgi:hypothetical protein